MNKITDQEFADLLANKPLYFKMKAVENLTGYTNAYLDHTDFTKKPFKFLCPHEDEVQTFKTDYGEKGSYLSIMQMLRDDPNKMPYTFDEKTGKLDLVIHIHATCQSCGHNIHFLLKVTSDREWKEREKGLSIFIQKVGQFPGYEIRIDDVLKKYLSTEDQTNYKKALVCLSTSYGIGAYSYLRRVIENEIKRIIRDVSELDFEGASAVRTAFETFQKDFQMSKLIDIVNRHLPISFQELGDNPIRLLYEQLSGGIHEFSDEECILKAQSIDILLKYVIKKINEEKYQLAGVRNAIKLLRKIS